MNNNRGNNRRRGRGNNNRPQGGGQQTNRIDSRARGNAPQLLEKYRKLAHDAHLNGDRVQAEYYLQFADHYFRVIADTRLRQEEARARREDRWQENGEAFREEENDGTDFSMDADFPAFDQPPVYTRREREDREPREQREPRAEREHREPREPRAEREPREERRPRREDAPLRDEAPVAEAAEADDAADQRNIYEPAENPFLRENRSSRGLRPRREDRRPRRDDRAPREDEVNADTPAEGAGLESALPPAISIPRREAEVEAAPVVDEAAEAPAPKRRVRRKPAADATPAAE
ncbi:DUF4167 domain-containing protein [Novosphingobium sp. FSY-8]|uniref:DUF4167 domain-containing protein n=1 Tax=Novosphingobium ovatum TaxID=1908523 RepID=A0ABW9XEU3_9SPHN|nr:DUF4167 domain-containing protein [Novosphingobium ovatum]NBC37068.1 DUF4167 domain-containing protein [Novosphingobium ovatum]